MKVRKTPQRMCVGCQQIKPKKEMIRVVRIPDGQIVLDATGKKSGRGAYVCVNETCLIKAVKEKRLERALKCPVPLEVYELLKAELGDNS